MEGFGVQSRKSDATREREVLERLYDTVVLYPGSGQTVANTPVESVPTIAKSSGRYGTVELQVDDAYGWMVDVRPDYTNHRIRATIWYSATGGSTTAFAITVQATGVDKVDAGLFWDVWSESTTMPGPAATHGQQSVAIVMDGNTAKSGDHHSIFWQITRTTDSNVNSLLIAKVELLFYKVVA